MKLRRAAGLCVAGLLTAWCAAASAQQENGSAPANVEDEAPLFRVFLSDGQSLVSFGEFARLEDQVVFSMPTSASAVAPQLQLITIPSERVDWERTLNYAEQVRAKRYLATRAATDYAAVTVEVERTLNDVGLTTDPLRRLALVERARRTLAEWPASHYNYKRDEIQTMLGVLDEVISDLRAATGANRFDLALVAPTSTPKPAESLLPRPGIQEAIEGTLAAAHLTRTPAERVSLLTVALNTIEAERANLPSAWLANTREATQAEIARELEADRKYQELSTTLLRLATARAARADVAGVQRVLQQIPDRDAELGGVRPDTIASMIAEVEQQLDAARRLRLELDRWAIRGPVLRSYRALMAGSMNRLQRMRPMLEAIKSLAGSGPDELGTILNGTSRIQRALASIEPPSELRDVHNLFVSAVQLADNAAKIRREAAIAGNITRAWDASSAAAGALMLAARARTEMQAALRPPQFAR
jgi:hypothetical protein